MNYIIKITSYDGQPQYVERMNGDVRAPNLTGDIRHAKEYPEEKALEYLEKVRGFISKKKDGETLTAELEAVISTKPTGNVSQPSEPPPPPEPPKTSPKRSPYYIEGWGEPRGYFTFGENTAFKLYMHKDSKGRISYAYTAEKGEIVSCNYDGAAIMTAFCVAARDYGVQKITEYEARRNG